GNHDSTSPEFNARTMRGQLGSSRMGESSPLRRTTNRYSESFWRADCYPASANAGSFSELVFGSRGDVHGVTTRGCILLVPGRCRTRFWAEILSRTVSVAISGRRCRLGILPLALWTGPAPWLSCRRPWHGH